MLGVGRAEGGNPTQATAAGSNPKFSFRSKAPPIQSLGFSPQMETKDLLNSKKSGVFGIQILT